MSTSKLLMCLGLAGAWLATATATAGEVVANVITVIHAGTLLPDPREQPLHAQSILVGDGRITAVQPGYMNVAGARVVDLRDSFVLPGLIDLHVHLTSTTVLDLGPGRRAHEGAICALRSTIAEGIADRPRILTVGNPLAPTGATRTSRYRAEVDRAPPPQGAYDGADDCRRATREQIARGADVINLYNSGSLNDPWVVPRTFTDAEFDAIVGRPTPSTGS